MLASSTFIAQRDENMVFLPMQHRPSYHHGDLKQTILKAALVSLEDSGLEKLSLRELAQSAGVSKTAPYRHFADRRQLLTEMAAEGFALLADRLEATVPRLTEWDVETNSTPKDRRDPLDPLKLVLKAYVEFARSRPELYKLMFSKLGYGLHSDRCKLNGDRAMATLMGTVRFAQGSGWKETQAPIPLVLSVWSLAHGWAGMLTERLVPESLAFDEDTWLEGVMDLLR